MWNKQPELCVDECENDTSQSYLQSQIQYLENKLGTLKSDYDYLIEYLNLDLVSITPPRNSTGLSGLIIRRYQRSERTKRSAAKRRSTGRNA